MYHTCVHCMRTRAAYKNNMRHYLTTRADLDIFITQLFLGLNTSRRAKNPSQGKEDRLRRWRERQRAETAEHRQEGLRLRDTVRGVVRAPNARYLAVLNRTGLLLQKTEHKQRGTSYVIHSQKEWATLYE